eukprot:SAG11_NODE_34072_length_274_cov_0.571429_1_plen_21_part_10
MPEPLPKGGDWEAENLQRALE